MTSIARAAKRLRQRNDEGTSLVEVIVAMAIFMLISIGIAQTTVTVLSLTSESRSKVTAANLAASEVDYVRSINDVFKVLNDETSVPVDGRTYTVKRMTAWVSTSGADVSCDSGAGVLQYKRVNISVTWTGMKSATPVRADTLLTPGSRINSPSTGTILVSVKDSYGAGNKDVQITAAAISGGAAVAAPPTTDANGCSYLLNVVPGTYKVQISEGTTSVGSDQAAMPSKSVEVTKGTSIATKFDYDVRGKFKLNYVPTPLPTVPLAGAPKSPSDLQVSFVSSLGTFVASSVGVEAYLYPERNGYQAIAGKYSPTVDAFECKAVDPGAWAVDPAAPDRTSNRLAAAKSVPNGEVSLDVPVSVLTVSRSSSSRTTLFAESDSTKRLPGQPTCKTTVTYKFSNLLATDSPFAIRLPFGSWKLYTAKADGSSVASVGEGQVKFSTGGKWMGGSIVALDPRGVTG